MFDIGFPELVLVSVIALIVIGPEKLPGTIRTISIWLGRLRHSMTTLRDEIEAEIGAAELKKQMSETSMMNEVKETKEQLDEMVRSARKEMNEIKSSIPSQSVISKPRGTTATDLEEALRKAGEEQKASEDETKRAAGGANPE